MPETNRNHFRAVWSKNQRKNPLTPPFGTLSDGVLASLHIFTTYFLLPYCATIGDFDLKKTISPVKGKILSKLQGFFLVKTQYPQYRDKVSHTGELWKLKVLTQSSCKWELWKLKVLTRHSTEPTHLGEVWKLQVLTHHSTGATHRGTLWKNSKSPHTTAQGPHTRKLFSLKGHFPKKTISSSTGAFLKSPAQGFFVKNQSLQHRGRKGPP